MALCLGIESTAHTFGVSVAEGDREGKGRILSDARSIYTPPPGEGIHPRKASIHHSQKGAEVLREALEMASVDLGEVDAIAYAAGPGLGPCLRVGAVVARALAAYYRKPLVPVNHAVGHIELSLLLTGAQDPLVLLVSGGHSLITAFAAGRWRIFGETLDLTVGQLIDQFGRSIGLASPAGPEIERLASKGGRLLPLPYSVKGNDVSFSGLLTAAKKLLAEGGRVEDLCYSLQETAFAMLVEVTERALAFTEKQEVLVVGGVAANQRLKEMMEVMCRPHQAKLYTSPLRYSGDCGAQIAWTGLRAYLAGVMVPVAESLIDQSWRLDRVDIPWRS